LEFLARLSEDPKKREAATRSELFLIFYKFSLMIPNFDQLLRPLLQLAAEGRITRRFATDQMAKQFTLSQEEAAQRIPSGGSTLIANRCGWAMTFLTKGCAPECLNAFLSLALVLF
jgi:hypothetical protein